MRMGNDSAMEPSAPPSAELPHDKLAEHVRDLLQDGETIRATIAMVSGPLHPMFPLIPVVGIIATLSKRNRPKGLLVTDRRLLVVRKGKGGYGGYGKVEFDAPLSEIADVEVARQRSSARVTLKAKGQRVRWYVVGSHQMDLPAALSALGHADAATAP